MTSRLFQFIGAVGHNLSPTGDGRDLNLICHRGATVTYAALRFNVSPDTRRCHPAALNGG